MATYSLYLSSRPRELPRAKDGIAAAPCMHMHSISMPVPAKQNERHQERAHSTIHEVPTCFFLSDAAHGTPQKVHASAFSSQDYYYTNAYRAPMRRRRVATRARPRISAVTAFPTQRAGDAGRVLQRRQRRRVRACMRACESAFSTACVGVDTAAMAMATGWRPATFWLLLECAS